MFKKIFVLLSLIVAPFSLKAAGPFDQVMNFLSLSGGAWLTTIEIKADPKMNSIQDKVEPCKLALVFCKNKDLEKKLMELSGPAFFAALEQIKKDHSPDLYIIVTDVLPNDQRTLSMNPKDNPAQEEIYESTKFVVGYVSYQTPGDHRFTILSGLEKVTLNFGPSDVAVVIEQKK